MPPKKLTSANIPYHPRITNLVCTAQINRTFSTKCLALLAYGLKGRFGAEVFPPCVVRLEDPRITCEVFPTGKIVACGAIDFIIATLGIYQVTAKISELMNIPLFVTNIQQDNAVVSFCLTHPIDLGLYHADNLENTMYSKGKFPGVHQFIGAKKPCLVLFEPGSGLATGLRGLEHGEKVIAAQPFHLYNRDAPYRRLDPETAARLAGETRAQQIANRKAAAAAAAAAGPAETTTSKHDDVLAMAKRTPHGYDHWYGRPIVYGLN